MQKFCFTTSHSQKVLKKNLKGQHKSLLKIQSSGLFDFDWITRARVFNFAVFET